MRKNENEERKVDPSKFLKWLMPRIKGDEGIYFISRIFCW